MLDLRKLYGDDISILNIYIITITLSLLRLFFVQYIASQYSTTIFFDRYKVLLYLTFTPQ